MCESARWPGGLRGGGSGRSSSSSSSSSSSIRARIRAIVARSGLAAAAALTSRSKSAKVAKRPNGRSLYCQEVAEYYLRILHAAKRGDDFRLPSTGVKFTCSFLRSVRLRQAHCIRSNNPGLRGRGFFIDTDCSARALHHLLFYRIGRSTIDVNPRSLRNIEHSRQSAHAVPAVNALLRLPVDRYFTVSVRFQSSAPQNYKPQ